MSFLALLAAALGYLWLLQLYTAVCDSSTSLSFSSVLKFNLCFGTRLGNWDAGM